MCKQIQKAGGNAKQLQCKEANIFCGITEKRAREIFSELSQRTIKENTDIALYEMNNRLVRFQDIVIPKIEKLDNYFSCFSDPSFIFALRKAQFNVICSERDLDYDVISELLIHRINNKKNIKKKASIIKAIDVIDYVDDDSLCALTLYMMVLTYGPTSGSIKDGIQALDNLFGKVDLSKLPVDTLWIDNLKILGIANTIPFAKVERLQERLIRTLDGYVCLGIPKESKEHIKALEKLNQYDIDHDILMDHELMNGYVRLAICRKKDIEDLVITDGVSIEEHIENKPLTQEQKDCLYEIFDSYSNDNGEIELVKKRFEDLLSSFPSMNTVIDWWNSLSNRIELTSIGKVIAQSNAKRLDPDLPDLD